MARRRKPINFEAIKTGDNTEIGRALEDLLRKYPTGPNGNLKKEDYLQHMWKGAVLSEHKHQELGLADDERWGYTAAQIWTIFEAMGCTDETVGEWELRRCLPRYYTCAQAGYTRKSRRLSNRYSDLYRREFNSGRLGDMIFDLQMEIPRATKSDLRAGKVSIVARNEEEALQVGKVMFAHVSKPRWASFVQRGGAAVLTKRNLTNVSEIEEQVARQKKIIEDAENQIALFQTHMEAVELYNINAFAE